jgi:hypothetical protein
MTYIFVAMTTLPLDIWKHHIVPHLGINELLLLDAVSRSHRNLTPEIWEPKLLEFEQKVTAKYAHPHFDFPFKVGVVSSSHPDCWLSLTNGPFGFSAYATLSHNFFPSSAQFSELTAKQKILAFLHLAVATKFILHQLLIPLTILNGIGSYLGFNAIESVLCGINLVALSVTILRFAISSDSLDIHASTLYTGRAIKGQLLVHILMLLFGLSQYSLAISLVALTVWYNAYNYRPRVGHRYAPIGARTMGELCIDLISPEMDFWIDLVEKGQIIWSRFRSSVDWSHMESKILSAPIE